MLQIAVVFLSAAVVAKGVVHIPQQWFFSGGSPLPFAHGCSVQSTTESYYLECDVDTAVTTTFSSLDCSGDGATEDFDGNSDCTEGASGEAYLTFYMTDDSDCDGVEFEQFDAPLQTCYRSLTSGTWSILYCLEDKDGSFIFQEDFTIEADCTGFEYPSAMDPAKVSVLPFPRGVCIDGGGVYFLLTAGGADFQCPRVVYCPDFVAENPTKNGECAHICNLIKRECLTDTGDNDYCHNIKDECIQRCHAFVTDGTAPDCGV